MLSKRQDVKKKKKALQRNISEGFPTCARRFILRSVAVHFQLPRTEARAQLLASVPRAERRKKINHVRNVRASACRLRASRQMWPKARKESNARNKWTWQNMQTTSEVNSLTAGMFAWCFLFFIFFKNY